MDNVVLTMHDQRDRSFRTFIYLPRLTSANGRASVLRECIFVREAPLRLAVIRLRPETHMAPGLCTQPILGWRDSLEISGVYLRCVTGLDAGQMRPG